MPGTAVSNMRLRRALRIAKPDFGRASGLRCS